jgi:hypothetical protein
MDRSLQDMEKIVLKFASQKQIDDRATKAVCEVITHLLPHVVFNPDCETAAAAVWDAAVAQRPKASCHDTKEGESCYTSVMWAMEHGIVMHPEWYPGLHVGSSFAEFQAHMDKIGHGGCKGPCDICQTSKPGEQCYEAATWAMEHGITLHPEAYGNLTSGSTFEEFQRFLYFEGLEGCKWPCSKCHTAVPDETCHAGVVWAMQHGIHEHPEWSIYSGLDADSSFVDFQAALHRHQINRCPEPCGLCHTAVEGEPCYEGVMWEMEYGIRLHPEWYPELTTNSSFEDVQAHLHEGNFNQCPEPCRH